VSFGGKYAPFVIGAYAISAVMFLWMVIDTLLRARSARITLEALEAERRGAGDAP
jgi:heme exporter protein CcmD